MSQPEKHVWNSTVEPLIFPVAALVWTLTPAPLVSCRITVDSAPPPASVYVAAPNTCSVRVKGGEGPELRILVSACAVLEFSFRVQGSNNETRLWKLWFWAEVEWCSRSLWGSVD